MILLDGCAAKTPPAGGADNAKAREARKQAESTAVAAGNAAAEAQTRAVPGVAWKDFFERATPLALKFSAHKLPAGVIAICRRRSRRWRARWPARRTAGARTRSRDASPTRS